MLTEPPDFRDPRVLGMAIAMARNPRVAALAAQIGRQAMAEATPPVPLRRTMRATIADLQDNRARIDAAALAAVAAAVVPDSGIGGFDVRLEYDSSTEPHEMPAQIVTLADALKNAQDALPRAVAAAQKLTANVADMVDAVSQVETLSNQVAKHTAGVRALLGGISNGGPPLDDHVAPAQPAPASPTA